MHPIVKQALTPTPNHKPNWPGIALCIALLPFPTIALGWLNNHLIAAILWSVAEYGMAAGILVWHYWKAEEV